MNIEFEATFDSIDKDDVRDRLKKAGAKLEKKEFLQKRATFHLPEGHHIEGGWLRVRDESDKITMSLKVVDGDTIEDQKEICLKIDNFDEAVEFLKSIGCKQKAYQENRREIWQLDDVEITIDEWPFLEPTVEIEGKDENSVKNVSEKLGFDYKNAIFGAIHIVYNRKYGLSQDEINNNTPRIVFDMENPFVNR